MKKGGKMPRPNKLNVETTSYNLTLPTAWKEHLSKESFIQSKLHNKEISIADLIRDAISEKLDGQECLKPTHQEKNES
tara:strand:- start:32 stop:265 length:234 start_codon:yes stop_codon:yes gene_type:complete